MARRTDPKTAFAQDLSGELEGDAKVLARDLFAGREPDGRQMSDADYAALVRRNWGTTLQGPDGQPLPWQQQEAQRNPEAFLRAFRAVGGVLPGEPGHPLTAPAPLDFSPTPMQAPPAGLPPSPMP